MNNVSDADEVYFREVWIVATCRDSGGKLSRSSRWSAPAFGDPADGQHGDRLDRNDRRRQLILAAVETWGAHGYSFLTIRNLAQYACVSHGSMHYYFASRDELVYECVEFVRDEIELDSSERMDAAPDINELVAVFVESVCMSMRTQMSLHRLRYDLLTQSMFDEDLVAHAESVQEAWMSGIEEFAHRVRGLRDPVSHDEHMHLVIEDMFARSVRRHTFDGVDAVDSFEADLRDYLRRVIGNKAA